MYYPLATRTLSSSSSKVDSNSKEADASKNSSTKVPLASDSPSREAGQLRVAEEEANITIGVAPDTTQPPTSLKDPSKEKEASHNMEIVLATLPMPAKEDLKSKGLASLTVAPAQPAKPLAKDKLVLKIK